MGSAIMPNLSDVKLVCMKFKTEAFILGLRVQNFF